MAVEFAQTGTLAEVPSMILGLTSAAAGTYVLNKSLQSNRPGDVRVRVGQRVTKGTVVGVWSATGTQVTATIDAAQSGRTISVEVGQDGGFGPAFQVTVP